MVYVSIEDVHKLSTPSAQLLGPFIFLSRKKGYQFIGCSKNGTLTVFLAGSRTNIPSELGEFDEDNCLYNVSSLQKAEPLDFNFHHIFSTNTGLHKK